MATNSELPTRQTDDLLTIIVNSFKLIGASWEAVRLNLNTFIVLAIAPALVIMALAVALFGGSVLTSKNPDFSLDVVLTFSGMTAIVGAMLLVLIASIALNVTQLASAKGEKISLGDAINRAMKFFWRFIGMSLLMSLIVIAGFALFLIPGVIAVFLLSLAGYFLIDKDTTPKKALGLSYRTVRKNWKVMLGVMAVQAVVGASGIILPPLGSMISAGLSIAYGCLIAIIYYRLTEVKEKAKKK